MPKSYTDELAEWVKQREATRPRQDKNVVAFLAVREKVQSGIDAGYALKTIWEHLHETGRIPYRYETFLKHVHRHITNAAKRSEVVPAPAAANPAPAEATPKAGKRAEPTPHKAGGKGEKPAAIPGFTFNANPDKKDLL